MLAGIEELETVLAESPSDYAIATVVAHAHIDMGWSWRGSHFGIDVSETNQNAFCAHFDRAADILAPFSELKPKPNFLAASECVQRSGRQDGARGTSHGSLETGHLGCWCIHLGPVRRDCLR
jgi:hypothetical protein